MKKLKTCLILFLAVSLSSCLVRKPPEEELCKCVNNEAFQAHGYLSEECLQACLNYFGEDLEGMESWFQKNCPSNNSEGQPQDSLISI